MNDRIVAVRAYTGKPVPGGRLSRCRGGHWIDQHRSSPMAKYPEYRDTRSSFGLNVLGTLVVEVESSSGQIVFGLSTGGLPACWIVEDHLSRFVEAASPFDVARIWDQMFKATLFYGRKGLVLNAISAVDLAIWDLIGRLRQAPVYELIGGAVRDELIFYATGARPDVSKELGFIGGKLPRYHHPSEGVDAARRILISPSRYAARSSG